MNEYSGQPQSEPPRPAFNEAPPDYRSSPNPQGSVPPAPEASQPPPIFRPTSAMAVWSLVNGLLGWFLCPVLCSMIAVVTGHMALGEIRRLNLDGKGLAIAGLVLGYSMLAIGLLCILGVVLMIFVFGSMGI